MLKICHSADLHFRSKNLEDIISSWEYVIDYLLNNKIDCFVIAGDLFDTYNISDKAGTVADIVMKINDGLVKLTKANIKVIIVEGNHDQAYGEHLGAIEILRHVESNKNLYIVTKEYSIININNINFICFPWYKNRQELIEDIDKCKQQISDINNVFVGHVFIKGSVNTHNIEVQDEIFITINELLEIPASVYCLGHIHMPQVFSDKIFYSGPICQLNFGEEAIDPKINIYTIENSKLSNFEQVNIPSKKYKNIDIHNIQELENFINNKQENNYYKIKTHFNLSDYKENETYIKATENQNITIVAQKINVIEREQIIEFNDYSPKNLLEKWCKHNNIENIPYKELEECIKENVNAD